MPRIKEPQPSASSYLNRELSWLQFNSRVLSEALDHRHPLLERVRYLSIFESNLDEFFMVRVSGLIEQFESGGLTISPDGLSPSEQLRSIAEGSVPMRQRASTILRDELLPELAKHGVAIVPFHSLSAKHTEQMNEFFTKEIFPLCTPLLLHPTPSVPFISSRSLNLAVELVDGSETKLARVKVPAIVPRLVRVSKRRHQYVLLEDLIGSHIQSLFPGVTISGVHQFRVIRDADVEIRELEASDLISSIEETLRLRRFGDPVLLQHREDMPKHVRALLAAMLELEDQDIMAINGELGLDMLNELVRIDKPALRYPPHVPYFADALSNSGSLFEAISTSDILVHHPFDSFRPVEEFVASAASDRQVVGIKQTLYRVGTESPIIESLARAADEGKQVAALVELKARFDESNNLGWARALERAGAHVTYGIADLKTHCKLCLVVRKEAGRLKAYAHIGTGNYNPQTARQYTDLGLFTCDDAITQDISELFNLLTGFGKQTKFRKILVAPLNLREGILDRIRRETAHAKRGKKAHITLKLNALVDPEVIDQLYEANRAGVEIDLIIRGVCCLRPGVEGMSERIRVRSLIGRFLEHSRVYYFQNGGEPDVLIGSADAMRRNLDRRVEVLVPVTAAPLIKSIRQLLDIQLADNVSAWELSADGTYTKRARPSREKTVDSQSWLMRHPITKSMFSRDGLGAH